MRITKSQLRKIIKESIVEVYTKQRPPDRDPDDLGGRLHDVLTILGQKTDPHSEKMRATLTRAVHQIENNEHYKANREAYYAQFDKRMNQGGNARIVDPGNNPFATNKGP